jgi:hypothetical protein
VKKKEELSLAETPLYEHPDGAVRIRCSFVVGISGPDLSAPIQLTIIEICLAYLAWRS